jgi:hypothetical protein
VTKEPNLKEIEKRAYMSYHQDGLLDIFAGLYILGFGLGIIMDVLWEFGFGVIMPAILIATVLPIWIEAKRKITMPRIGFVNFGTRGANKLTAFDCGTPLRVSAGINATLRIRLAGSYCSCYRPFHGYLLCIHNYSVGNYSNDSRFCSADRLRKKISSER